MSLAAGTRGASVDTAGLVSIDVGARTRIIPFTVARPDNPELTSSAFIRVPGTDDARPERRRRAPTLTVESGERLVIPIGDHVVAASDRRARILDPATVSATLMTAAPTTQDDTTLVYRSDEDAWGTASLTFSVTDAPAGQRGNEATITLPITVTPKVGQPPVMTGVRLTLEAGSETTVDLAALTEYPYPARRNSLRFSAESGDRSIVGVAVSGRAMTIRAVDGVPVGSSSAIVVSPSDGDLTGRSAVIDVSIVRSTRAPVSPQPDVVVVRRGATATIDVLANDEPTNPFPGQPLRVVDVDVSSVPAGVSVRPSSDRSRLTVSVDSGAATGGVAVPYRVADITDDESRYRTGQALVRVQDVPDAPPAGPTVVSTDVDRAAVRLAIPHAFPNASEITEYQVRSVDGSVAAVCANPDACVVKGLAFGRSYGFVAWAVNGVGEGAPSPASAAVVIDTTPEAPGSVTVSGSNADSEGHAIAASWSAVASAMGTPVTAYVVTVSGPSGVLLTETVPAARTKAQFSSPGIQPGQPVTVSVAAQNQTNTGPQASGSATAVGPPSLGVVRAAVADAGSRLQVVVEWETRSNGGAAVAFSVSPAIGGESGVCDPASFRSNVPSGSSWTDTRPASAGQYVVAVSNSLFCRQFVSGPVQLQPELTGGTATVTDGASGTIDLIASGFAASGPVHHFEASVVPSGTPAGAWVSATDGGVIASSSSYGRTVDVWGRACAASSAHSCGAPRSLGSELTPLRIRATVTSCFVDARPPIVAAPDNNGLPMAVEVSYLSVSADGRQHDLTGWLPASQQPPSPPPGSRLAIRTRLFVAGSWFEAPRDTAVVCR